MKWGRKFKLSNPPKKSGFYWAFYDDADYPYQRYFDVNSSSWYPGLESFKLGYKALFEIGKEPHYRWARIIEE